METVKKTLTLEQFISTDYFTLRFICMLCCIPSAGALLLKVWGLMQMQTAILFIYLPCIVFLLCVWVLSFKKNYSAVGEAITIGLFAGLLATFAYDLTRVPFLLMGQRVFMTITTYGMWISDAEQSSRFTDFVGWAYHFSNGMTFGVIYALFMRGRHWLWAVLYACILETIALSSPFRPIFGLSNSAIGILYIGHVAYGLPLGFICQHWDSVRDWLQRLRPGLKWGFWCVCAAVLAQPVISSEKVVRDQRRQPGSFVVEGKYLNPDFVRIPYGGKVAFSNPGKGEVAIVDKTRDIRRSVLPEQEIEIAFEKPGIYQLLVDSQGRSRSSFVIVENVEEQRFN